MEKLVLTGTVCFIRLLEVVYERAKKDCEQKIMELSARTDLENLQSIVYQGTFVTVGAVCCNVQNGL